MLMLAKTVINEDLPWRLRQHIPLKRLKLSTQPYITPIDTCCCARHTSRTYIRVFNLVMKNLRYSFTAENAADLHSVDAVP